MTREELAGLAEALNATHDKGALEAGRKATILNPGLVEGWRELGDAERAIDPGAGDYPRRGGRGDGAAAGTGVDDAARSERDEGVFAHRRRDGRGMER